MSLRRITVTLAIVVVTASITASTTACGGASTFPDDPTIEDLRRAAREAPRDPDAQRALALAELLMEGGDASRAEAQIERALALAPEDERLLLVAGVERNVHGHPERALERYLDAVDAARRSRRPSAPHVAEAALVAVGELEETAPRWSERVAPRLEAVVRQPGSSGAAARHRAVETLIEIAYRRGEPARVERLAEAAGCVTDWRVAGPFGPRTLVDFDESFGVDPGAPLGERYDLGPGRGVRPVRAYESRGCAVHLGGGPVAAGGTTFAQGEVRVERGGRHVLRLETPNAAKVWVDGERVARLDARVLPVPRTTFHVIDLAPGTHRVSAQITTRHPNPILVASVIPVAERPGRPEADGPFATYLAAVVALARGDVVGAREALHPEARKREAASAVLQLAAGIALADPHRPDDVNRDEARRLLRAAAGRDPQAWYPPVQLARLDAADGRVLQAIARLRTAEERWPRVVDVPLSLVDLLLGRGWYGQADLAVERARRAAPGACRPVQGAMASAERRHRHAEVATLSQQMVACDARSSARFQSLVHGRRWDEAAAELERLAALEPRQAREGILSGELRVARGRGDDEAVARILASLAEAQPQSLLVAIERVDRLLAAGQEREASALLAGALAAEPAALAELRLVRRAIDERFALTPFRLDGAEALRAFEASGRTYEEPEVLVLDYTAVRVFEDGSTLELTHNIWKVQSEEALDERGEFQPPPGARVLRLHTIKADGRRIEPDAIEGKDTISLPNLAPGDYVEYELVRIGDPPAAFPGGYLGERFYFRSYETPFDRSELVVALPPSMEPLVDPRGPAPEVQEQTVDGVRVLRWSVTESRPLVPEPMSVAPREFIPSVSLGVGATWEDFVESLRDVLADRDVRDPAARRRVAAILGEARSASRMARARRLYGWVLENVEESQDAFGLAPAMLADRTGNRSRVLHYALALAGVPSKLVLARSAASDHTESRLPDAETYEHLLVMLGEGDDAIFLSTTERGAPFGYLPPLLRGQPALVLAEGAPTVRLPQGEDGADRRTVEVDAHLRQDGSATVEVVETFRGAGAVSWRDDLEGVPAAVLESRFEEAYVARLVPGATMTRLRIIGRDQPEQPLVFEYAFDVRSLGRRQGDRWIVPGLFPTNVAPVHAALGERTTTQLIASPLDLDVRVTVHAPPGETAPAPPADVRLRGPGGARFQLTAERDGGAVTLRRHVRIPIMRVPPDRYPAFARFARALDQAESRELVF